MLDASLIWTGRTWPHTSSSPPFLTAPPEQPGWSTAAHGAVATPIPAKGFLAAVFDSPSDETSAAARSALEHSWRELDTARVSADLAETVNVLARAVEESHVGGANFSAVFVLVRGDTMAWSSSGDCRLFFCRAGSAFEELTRDRAPSQGERQVSPGDLLILGNSELARRTTITGQAGDIENITEDNADGWLESLSEQNGDGAPITFCMIGVRAVLPTTITSPVNMMSAPAPVMVAIPTSEHTEAEATPNLPSGLRSGRATVYPAASAPADTRRGLPVGRIIAIVSLVALLGLGGLYVSRRGAASLTPAAGSPTAEPTTSVGLQAETRPTEAPTASPTEAAAGGVAATLEPEESAVPTTTPAPATPITEPNGTPTAAVVATEPTSQAAPIATSPAVIYGAFVYPRLLDDTGYNNSVEFLTTLFGPPTAEDPAYVAYIRDYVTSNPDARCPSGAVIWFCLGGREIPDLIPAPAWVAFTGEITTASDEGFVLQGGAQTYAITGVQGLAGAGTLTTGTQLSIVGRVEGLTWDPAAPSGTRIERAGAAIPVAAAFVRPVSSDSLPGEWQRLVTTSSAVNRPIWLYSSDQELLDELIQLPAEAAEALAQGNVLIQGTLDQTAGASPRIQARAVYTLDLTRNRYVCRYGELPDATCP